jgi:Leucine-rich repeat (LRR) protein
MTDINPTDIFNDFKNGKVDGSVTVEKLLANASETRDEKLRLEISDILLEMYRTAEAEECEDLEKLSMMDMLEKKIGKRFISKYNIAAREAMALGLIELIMQIELDNDDEIHNEHHVHAAYRAKDTHVFDLDIAEKGCSSKICFLDLLPNLVFLRISMVGLKEIQGVEVLSQLEHLDLAGNSLTKIEGLENLSRLEKLDLNLNRFRELKFFNSMEKLEEVLLSFNPLEKLEGVNMLNSLKYIELEETNLPKSFHYNKITTG